MARKDFLDHLRIARSLRDHARPGATPWLTPEVVADFEPSLFSSLSPARLRDLEAAVASFRIAAEADDKIRGGEALDAILATLAPDLPTTDEMRRADAAIRKVEFPTWVESWHAKMDINWEGESILRLGLITSAKLDKKKLGLRGQLTAAVRHALTNAGIDRWPRISFRKRSEILMPA